MADTPEEFIEVDPAAYGGGDGYESAGYDSSTVSLSSSINEYIFENGRRYHAYFGREKNLLPTDETEQDRLDLHHEIFLEILAGELHKAPLNNPQRILDVGTGTGIWAVDVADTYPMAEVIGTDLSPLQPTWVPPNCRFEVDDCEQNWTFRQDYFDFIHMRNLAQSISDWSRLMPEVYRCTKPGGWVELAEVGLNELLSDDGTLLDGDPAKRCVDLLTQAMELIGRPAPTVASMRANLETAGFVDIHVCAYKQPFGPWPKDKRLKHVGAMALLMLQTGIEAYVMASFSRILGMEQEEAAKLCQEAYASCSNRKNHFYNHFYVVYGRKPGGD
ncbi:S-adenosyl-L-methionine-dependent methyltransferase [Tricharina praecox]|uniref:S-adenosyl-L-methionine-dependent methyltransferase n=1 Tax=Tricharina praecox TaxID=43433 RepID=UPI00221F1F0A|nr:S-adenosyl-L-methionine-dependent methyltransferase [Tricharina praecox]KAI5845348.1 S-adenosyl-L-methionine-dependent methyltransferase [Tricharina praecox]